MFPLTWPWTLHRGCPGLSLRLTVKSYWIVWESLQTWKTQVSSRKTREAGLKVVPETRTIETQGCLEPRLLIHCVCCSQDAAAPQGETSEPLAESGAGADVNQTYSSHAALGSAYFNLIFQYLPLFILDICWQINYYKVLHYYQWNEHFYNFLTFLNYFF